MCIRDRENIGFTQTVPLKDQFVKIMAALCKYKTQYEQIKNKIGYGYGGPGSPGERLVNGYKQAANIARELGEVYAKLPVDNAQDMAEPYLNLAENLEYEQIGIMKDQFGAFFGGK